VSKKSFVHLLKELGIRLGSLHVINSNALLNLSWDMFSSQQ